MPVGRRHVAFRGPLDGCSTTGGLLGASGRTIRHREAGRRPGADGVRWWGPRTPCGGGGVVGTWDRSCRVREPVAKWISTSLSTPTRRDFSCGCGPLPPLGLRFRPDREVDPHRAGSVGDCATGSRGPDLVSEVPPCAPAERPDRRDLLRSCTKCRFRGPAAPGQRNTPNVPARQLPERPGKATRRASGQGNSPNVWADQRPGPCRHTSQRLRDSRYGVTHDLVDVSGPRGVSLGR